MSLDPRIFPWTLITLDVLASIAYLAILDWRRGVYWLAAAVLTLMVTI